MEITRNYDVEKEYRKLNNAVAKTRIQLKEIKNNAIAIGTNESDLFESQLVILKGHKYLEAIKAEIKNQHITAIQATKNVAKKFHYVFSSFDHDDIREKIVTLKDLNERLVHNLKVEDYADIIQEQVEFDGKIVRITGNVKKHTDVHQVILNGGDGVGLFRTEFLYKNRETEPSEQEQFECYKYVLQYCNNNPVVIRTIDIGGDVPLPYSDIPTRNNHLLGYLGVQLRKNSRSLFKTQVKALLRASFFGNLQVAFPMVTERGDYEDIMEIVEECKNELINDGMDYSNTIQWGVMIETPAAALFTQEMAEFADFFCIGINDLTKHALAIDIMQSDDFCFEKLLHPAVLELVRVSVTGAHKCGKWIGMCGDLQGDSEKFEFFVKLGLDGFSVNPTTISDAKKGIHRMIKELNKSK